MIKGNSKFLSLNKFEIKMRSILIFCITSFILSSSIKAQVMETESNMSLGVQVANEVVLEDISPKEAFKLWKDYFKEYGKIKRNKKANEYYSTGVKINRIFSASKIDFYTRFEERGSSTTMTAWVDLGMAFVNSEEYPSEYKAVVQMLEEFRIIAREFVVGEELKLAEKDLDKMKKELAKLEKDKVNLHQKIEDYMERIRNAENQIVDNRISQDEKRKDIERQLDILKEIQIRLKSIRSGR